MYRIFIFLCALIAASAKNFESINSNKYDNEDLIKLFDRNMNSRDFYINDVLDNNYKTTFNSLENNKYRKTLEEYDQCSIITERLEFSFLYGEDYEFDPPKFVNITCQTKELKDSPYRSNNYNNDFAKIKCYTKNTCRTVFGYEPFLRRRKGENCWGRYRQPVAKGCTCHEIFN